MTSGWTSQLDNNIAYEVPIPSNWGRVFTSVEDLPEGIRVVNEQPFVRADLSGLKELEVSRAVVVFNRQTGEFITAYPQAVPDQLLR